MPTLVSCLAAMLARWPVDFYTSGYTTMSLLRATSEMACDQLLQATPCQLEEPLVAVASGSPSDEVALAAFRLLLRVCPAEDSERAAAAERWAKTTALMSRAADLVCSTNSCREDACAVLCVLQLATRVSTVASATLVALQPTFSLLVMKAANTLESHASRQNLVMLRETTLLLMNLAAGAVAADPDNIRKWAKMVMSWPSAVRCLVQQLNDDRVDTRHAAIYCLAAVTDAWHGEAGARLSSLRVPALAGCISSLRQDVQAATDPWVANAIKSALVVITFLLGIAGSSSDKAHGLLRIVAAAPQVLDSAASLLQEQGDLRTTSACVAACLLCRVAAMAAGAGPDLVPLLHRLAASQGLMAAVCGRFAGAGAAG